MRDSAGELADRLELLRLTELQFEALPLDLRSDRRQQIGDRQCIGLLVGHPPATRSRVVTGQHTDRRSLRADRHRHHRRDSAWLQISLGEFGRSPVSRSVERRNHLGFGDRSEEPRARVLGQPVAR